ncbi:hypothetical protein LUZ60_016125 [Juncus effusus]|nr:hypothetical protein LUZ60_016125 [Juncus effusus]
MDFSTLGGWVGSALIGKLVDMISFYVQEKYDQYQRDDSKEKLKKLEKNLRLIHGILDYADIAKIKNPSITYLIEDIKDAAYDAEDLLDTLDYRVLAAKVEKEDEVATDSSLVSHSTLKRPRDDFEGHVLSDVDYDVLISITNRFDKIIDEMPMFLKLMESHRAITSTGISEVLEWRKTTSMPIESKVFGRTSEEEQLKRMLMRTDGRSYFCGQIYTVLSIVGIGGVGKTTLAQSIYNNQDISKYFDLRAWACVSDKFDLRRLTIEIIESSCMETKEDIERIQSLDKIQREFQKGVAGKRILIVLDDLWHEINSQWETFRKPFQFAKEGSVVIVTTRDKNVTDLMGSSDILDLKGIEEEEYWKFFVQCAFNNRKPEENPKLVSIGRQIVRKLKGSPLAAKTVGAALRFKLNEQHWTEILESKLWQVEQREDDIIPALKLSYEHLPGHLKECFVYFALFPKDHRFEKDVLIQLWMAHGFIHQSGRNILLENSGADYIDEMLSRSFLEKVMNSEDQYVVHDLLHDVAESISNGEHYRVELSNNLDIKLPSKIRHINLYARDMRNMISHNKDAFKNFRSLVICREPATSGQYYWGDFVTTFQETIKELTNLRVLITRDLDFPPEPIDHLIHLRYMDIRGNSISDLPKSYFKLYHLLGLNLQDNPVESSKKQILKGVNKLINLRFLSFDSDFSSQGLLKISLEEDYMYQLEQLKDNKQFHALSISKLEKLKSMRDSGKAELGGKNHIKKLSLFWSYLRGKNCVPYEHASAIEGLKPHPNLKELEIVRYMGIKCPRWLNKICLSNLEQLQLLSCIKLVTLPPLGELHFLKILKIRLLPNVKFIDTDFYGHDEIAFPSLQELSFEEMAKWERWTRAKAGQDFFPFLRKLTILGCRKLTGTLPLPDSFRNIKINIISNMFQANMPQNKSTRQENICVPFQSELIFEKISFLTKYIPITKLDSIHVLYISCSILAFTNELENWLLKLVSLEELCFYSCRTILSLPSVLNSLTTLRVLRLEDCHRSHHLTIEPNTIPSSLELLEFKKCDQLLKSHFNWRTGCYWPLISRIPSIIIDGKVIETDIRVRGP